MKWLFFIGDGGQEVYSSLKEVIINLFIDILLATAIGVLWMFMILV